MLHFQRHNSQQFCFHIRPGIAIYKTHTHSTPEVQSGSKYCIKKCESMYKKYEAFFFHSLYLHTDTQTFTHTHKRSQTHIRTDKHTQTNANTHTRTKSNNHTHKRTHTFPHNHTPISPFSSPHTVSFHRCSPSEALKTQPPSRLHAILTNPFDRAHVYDGTCGMLMQADRTRAPGRTPRKQNLRAAFLYLTSPFNSDGRGEPRPRAWLRHTHTHVHARLHTQVKAHTHANI